MIFLNFILFFFVNCFYISDVHTQSSAGILNLNDLGYTFGRDRLWQKETFRMQNRFSHPTHLILASRTVRPSTIYRCVVTILHIDHPVDVRASLQRDGVEIASNKKDILKGSPEALLLRIPKTVADGRYVLRVEGNVPGSSGGTIFYNETLLHFSTRFLTVLMQTNRPIYTGDQFVRFRIILLTTELKPYDDPVDVFIMDSDGYVMRRWPSRPTNVGVISMSFKLPFLAKEGWWKLRAEINGQIEEKRFKVEKWYTPRFETKVFMKKFFIDSLFGNITGRVAAEFVNDKGAYGSAIMSLFGRSPLFEGSYNYTDWKLIYRYDVYPFDGVHFFNFTMTSVKIEFINLDGVELKVEANVQDAFMRLNHTGWSLTKIINSTINCRFIGSPPFIFKAGMPFHGAVAVSYHDLQPLSRKKLGGSTLVISAELSGGGGHVPNVVVPRLAEEKLINRRLEKALNRKKKYLEYKSYYGDKYEINYEDYNEFDENYVYDVYDSQFKFMNEDELIAARIELLLNRSQYETYREKGYYEFDFDVPPGTGHMTLTVRYQDDENDQQAAQVDLLPFYSSKNEYLSVETTNKKASVGEYVIFNVRANFKLEHFEYLIMAKDMVLYAAKERMGRESNLKTISVPVSTEMAPSFSIVIYYVNQENEIVSDSLTIPVDSISKHKVKLLINMEKDHTLHTVELGTFSSPGSFFGISGTRYFTYAMQGENELSHSSVLASLHSFTNSTRPIHKMLWRSREGLNAEQATYFVTGNYGPDANRTFLFNGLVAITDAYIGVMPGYRDIFCNITEGWANCLTAGCYPVIGRCNGIRECADGYDEIDCVDPLADVNLDFRVHQFSRFFEIYDAEEGDWMWIDTNIGHKGYEVNTVSLPKVDDLFIVNAFSMSPILGFGLIEGPLEFLSLPPIYMQVEMPDRCRRGETVGLRTMVYNTTPLEHMIMIIVHGSPKHKIVQVGDKGVVDYYRPETKGGDHQHLVTIQPDGMLEVIFPIVPLIDHGTLTVTVSTISQVGRDEDSVTLSIDPEGATINRHTSTILDLKSRALVFKYLDIIIDESYEIPLKILRRFVAGSPVGHLSLCGDVVGPSFPNNVPVDSEQMLRKILRGTEASTFNFGANLWTLHYLRLTNQLDYSKYHPMFENLNVELAAIMYRFDANGAFRMWDTSNTSVWLTALTTRTLQQAQFQDWENLIYIQPSIISKAVSWLLQFQHRSGYFFECDNYKNIPLSHTLYSMPSASGTESTTKNISLTAHVLITLEQTIESLQGDARGKANNARFSAMRYLERNLPRITDPYEMAITAYALSLTNSVEKEAAYSYLNSMKRHVDGFIYWSRSEIQTNKQISENNQRLLLQPKFEQEWDAHAVEATSYALLVYLFREGVTIDQNLIVNWLNAMRMHDGGFISTVDTLIALQALTEYSYRARLRDITDMKIEMEVTGEAGVKDPHLVRITNGSVSDMTIVEIEKVWGMVTVTGRGAGQAILQLDVAYGVDWDGIKKLPPVDAFDMTVFERFDRYGNKSIADVEICARWINLKESPHSAATVIEIENPTGYVVYQLEAEESIKRAQLSTFPSIRDVIGGHSDFYQYKTVWFFDFIPGNESWCFQYKMRRWYPVANMTNVRMATIYEQYQPERFQMVMFNSSTSSLDVCEVCASYQCPYCPIYSSVPSVVASWTTTFLSVISIVAVIHLFDLPQMGLIPVSGGW